LAELSQRVGLTDEDLGTLERLRDTTPAEPFKF
jgi:hypothetical protein